ncbi:hypothetical protein BGZ65_006510, partial [Modicella reniformis]
RQEDKFSPETLPLAAESYNQMIALKPRNVDALRITEIDTDNHALVARSQGSPSKTQLLQHTPNRRSITYSQEPAGKASGNFAGDSKQSLEGNRDTESNSNIPYQEQLRQLQQRIDDFIQKVQQTEQKMHQRIEDVVERLQQTDQRTYQLKQQIEDVLQQTDQQTHHQQPQTGNTIQQGHQMLQHMHETNQGNRQEMPSHQQTRDEVGRNLKETHQLERQEFDRFMAIKSYAQALLTRTFKELPVPRLFIILPNIPGIVDKDEMSSSLQFRLYYLCECGDHTMTEDTKGYHEIHLAEHPGYDLDNHKGLFDKYGSYLLIMLYMVKYGAVANGRVVPPLQSLKIAKKIDMDKSRLSRQVSDMISYLEDTFHINGSDMDQTANWEVESSELAQLKSYLNVKEGENIFGNLHSTTTQNRHCVWVCSGHQREYHESTTQQLKDVIIADDGEYSEEIGNIKIKISSNTLAKRFYDAAGKVRWIQSLDNRWSLTALDLKLDFNFSLTTSTAHILLNLNSIDSLVLDFIRLLLSAGTSPDGTRYMKIEMEQLSDLTSDDLKFIHQYHHDQLTIKSTPKDTDEDRLVGIMQHSFKLEVLCIGCVAVRSPAVIDLVISTREKALQSGHSFPLRTLEMMDEGLIPCDSPCTYRNRISSTVTFSSVFKEFDMRTNVKLLTPVPAAKDNPINNFFRQYGWTFVTLETTWAFTDIHASLLYDSIRERGSRITTFGVDPCSLTTPGLDAIDLVIRKSPSLVSLGLRFTSLDVTNQLDKTLLLLERYQERLDRVVLKGTPIETWLPKVIQAYPTRNNFPKLTKLNLGQWYDRSNIPHDCVHWVMAMVSAPPLPSSTSAMEPHEQSTRLKGLGLHKASLQPEDWVSVIKAIDFEALEWLKLEGTNASMKELELLVHRITDGERPPPQLRSVYLNKQLLDNDDARALCSTLSRKAPLVKIVAI